MSTYVRNYQSFLISFLSDEQAFDGERVKVPRAMETGVRGNEVAPGDHSRSVNEMFFLVV